MKIISLVLALCLSLNVFAASGTHKELELLIDSYQFDLSVEWDQKDQKLSYKFGSLQHVDKSVRDQAIEHNLQVIRHGENLGSKSQIQVIQQY
jgi:L-rhamnose isomerase